MQFILIALDGTDAGASERRLKNRPAHIEKIAQTKKAGNFIFGGAMLNDKDEMIGSAILYEVVNREELDRILKDEPYIINKVWEKIDIRPFRLVKVAD
jgi:hypothetical protein